MYGDRNGDGIPDMYQGGMVPSPYGGTPVQVYGSSSAPMAPVQMTARQVGNVKVGGHYQPFTAGKVPWTGNINTFLNALKARGCDMTKVGYVQVSRKDNLPYVYYKLPREGGPLPSAGKSENPYTWKITTTGMAPGGMGGGMGMGMGMAPRPMGMGMAPRPMGMGMAPRPMGMGMAPRPMGMGMGMGGGMYGGGGMSMSMGRKARAMQVGNTRVGGHYHAFSAGKVPWTGNITTFLAALQARGCDMRQIGFVQYSRKDNLPYTYYKLPREGGPSVPSAGMTDNPMTWKISFP